MIKIQDPFPEHYRPQNMGEMILPNRLNELSDNYIKNNALQHLVLYSRGAGYGKTSFALALVKELGAQLIFIKGGSKVGIDRIMMLEEQLTQIQSVDILGSVDVIKRNALPFDYIVIIDEADQLSMSAQKAFKNVIESFSDRARFIFTTNYINKLDHHMIKRCVPLNFLFSPAEQQEMLPDTVALISRVINDTGLEYDKKAIPHLIKKTFPSLRDMLNALETIMFMGKRLTVDSVNIAVQDVDITVLLEYMIKNDFGGMKNWVNNNTQLITGEFYHKLNDAVSLRLQNFIKKHPESDAPLKFLYIMDDYQYKHSGALSISIQISALCARIMEQGWLNDE